MTEEKIMNMLLEIETQSCDQIYNTKLQSEVLNKVVKNIADLIYESLLNKTSESSIKRGSLLKFITSITEMKEPHSLVNIEDVLQLLKKDFDLKDVASQSFSDLDISSGNILNYFENKNIKCIEKLRQLEFIKSLDQNRLMSKYQLTVKKKQTGCIIKDSNLKYLLDIINKNDNSNKYDCTHIYYREQLINLAYSLLNNHFFNSEVILKKILNIMTNYKQLTEAEKNFLTYLWLKKMGENSAINFMLETHYFFILERILLKHANYILKLNDEFKVQHYLKENEEVMKLKINQLKTKDVYFKIKQILYELYCFSFCNANILKLSDAICISSFTE